MPDYVVELRMRKDSIKRGVQIGAGTQVARTTPPKDHITTWSFKTTDTPSTVTTSLDAIIESLTGVGFGG